MRVEFHPRFWEDVEGQAVYVKEAGQLGEALLDAVEEAVATIIEHPDAFRRRAGGLRIVPLQRFGRHIVVYELAGDQLRFLGLFHSSMNPRRWRGRRR